MKIIDRLAVVIVLTIISFLTARSQNTLQGSSDEKVLLTSNRSYTMSQNIMGQEITLSSTSVIDFNVTLKRSDQGIASIAATIKHLIVNGEVMNKQVSFDSDKEGDLKDEFGSLLKGVLNRVVEVKISGNNFSYTNTESNQSDEIIATLLGGKIDVGFPEEIIFESRFKNIGDSIVIVGNPSDTDNNRKIVYSLKSYSGSDATIIFTGIESVKNVKKNQGLATTTFVENKITGQMILDINSGIIKQRRIEIEGNGKTMTLNQSIPFSSKQIIISNLKK